MFFFKSAAVEANDKLFYDLKINDISGNRLNLNDYRNKVILLVNTASYCGFTKQYDDLQKLWEKYREKDLIVIGMPSNQFGGQEPGSNTEIKDFCETNFNINFLMTSKQDVKGENAHEIYKWAKISYGKSAVPKWNFHKILINNEGIIVDTFASFTNPMSKKVVLKIEKILN